MASTLDFQHFPFVRAVIQPDCQQFPYDDPQSAHDVALFYTATPHEAARPADVEDDDFEPTSQSLSDDAWDVEYTGDSHLCLACRGALGYLARVLGDCITDERGGGGGSSTQKKKKMSVVHHHSLMALFTAANEGCQLCKTIWGRRFKHNGVVMDENWRTDFCWNTTDEESWDGRLLGDARLICNLVSTVAKEHNQNTWETIFRFQFWPSPGFDGFFEKKRQEDFPTLAPAAERGNTRSSKALALHWLSECKANADGEHSACCQVNNVTSWYPTRLLDLSRLEDTGMVFLVLTSDFKSEQQPSSDRGDYITLSHCWGAWGAKELPALKASNMDERVKNGISLSLLPPTFRDAIEIAGWFGTKYLWIDSLCIIQDSREDWQREAPTMCDVYQNALLNISADDAVDARDGCFHDRYSGTVEPFKLYFKALEAAWWVSVDERNLFDWVKTAPSSERAWIYQERHLARRVLHFTAHEVFWECRTCTPSFRSETFPHSCPLGRVFLGQPKLQLQDTSPGSISDNPLLLVHWDAACRAYSRRKLTYQTDKLPAFSGIARHFGTRCQNDTYVAGIWLSQLPRALLWNVPVRERPRSRPPPDQSGAPSWSWMSCAAPVETSKAEDSYYIADTVLMAVDDHGYKKTTGDHQYGELTGAVAIHVYGFARQITSVMEKMADGPMGAASAREIDGSKKYRHLYLDGELGRDVAHGPNGMQQFGELSDWFHGLDPVEYTCLFLAISQATPADDRLLYALLLEPSGQTAGGRSSYRRVGTVFFRGQCALRMRYRLVRSSDETDEEGAWERLWELVAPNWGDFGSMENPAHPQSQRPPPLGALPVAIQNNGPETLYEFDGDIDAAAEHLGFEKLEAEIITLI